MMRSYARKPTVVCRASQTRAALGRHSLWLSAQCLAQTLPRRSRRQCLRVSSRALRPETFSLLCLRAIRTTIVGAPNPGVSLVFELEDQMRLETQRVRGTVPARIARAKPYVQPEPQSSRTASDPEHAPRLVHPGAMAR